MSFEDPFKGKVVDLGKWKKRKAIVEGPRDYDPDKIKKHLEKVTLEQVTGRTYREKWEALEQFAKEVDISNPEHQDLMQAKTFKSLSSEDLINEFRKSNEHSWKRMPIAFKTIYEELERRMKGEDSETSSE